MNLFYEDYPTHINTQGGSYEIKTDYRGFIRLKDTLRNKHLDSTSKMIAILSLFVDLPDTPDEILACMDELVDFMRMKVGVDSGQGSAGKISTKKDVYSFEFDFGYIISGFLEAYGIDLEAIEYMHWWKFMHLLNGLPDKTQFKQRVSYRSINLSDIRNTKERQRISEIQRQIAIPSDEVMSDYDIGNAFV